MMITDKIDKYLNEMVDQVDIENFIYDYGEKRKGKLDKDQVYKAVKAKFKRFDDDDFEEAYDALVDNGKLMR